MSGEAKLYSFDSTGKSLGLLGSQGRGPNQFQLPLRLFLGSNDSLLVIDPPASRLTVLTPNGAVSKSFSFLSARPFDAVSAPDGLILLNAVVRDRIHVGYPLHVVSRDGEIRQSFGVDTADYIYNAPPIWRRRVSEPRGAAVWTARELRYVLEQWSLPDGLRLRTIKRQSEWFTESQDLFEGPTLEKPPANYIADVIQRSDGLIWVVAAVPDQEWVEGLKREPRPADGQPTFRPTDYSKLYDTMLELIDPDAGAVVSSTRLDEYVWGFIGERQLATYRLSPNASEDLCRHL